MCLSAAIDGISQAASHPFITGQPHPRDLGALTIVADPLIEKRFSNQMQRQLQQQKDQLQKDQQQKDQQEAERKHAQRLRLHVRICARAKSGVAFFLTKGGKEGNMLALVLVKCREMAQD